jgi:adenosylcobyric acid synthase
MIVGICGGYQMLGTSIVDKEEIESSYEKVEGLGLIPMKTFMTQNKTTTHSEGMARFGEELIPVMGYEIHMGESFFEEDCSPFIELSNRSDGTITEDKQLIGTYFHGIFHNDRMREVILNEIRSKKGLEPIYHRASFAQKREVGFDLLAKVVRENIQLDLIYQLMADFQQGQRQ